MFSLICSPNCIRPTAVMAACLCLLAAGVAKAQRFNRLTELSLLPPVDLPSVQDEQPVLEVAQLPVASPHEELRSGEPVDVMGVLPPPSPSMYYAPDDPPGLSIRIFEPKARVYFDTGWEAPDKLDIFHDGSLAPSINFVELYWTQALNERFGHPDWRWGPNIGVGIGSRAEDSLDGSVRASAAPVLLMSYGFLFEFPLTSSRVDYKHAGPGYGPRRFAPTAGIECGYAMGVASDRSHDFAADGAFYVGVSLHMTP